MSETIIVVLIIAVAVAYAAYRIFVRPSCGCGNTECSSKKNHSSTAPCCMNKGKNISSGVESKCGKCSNKDSN